MSRYRVRTEQEKIVFWVKPAPFQVIQQMPSELDDINEESITIVSPTWKQIAIWHTMASGGGMIPFAPDKEMDKLLLKYCLVDTSFFEVERDVEEDGTTYMVNLDEMLESIHPSLIDHVVLRIRQRM